MKLLLIDADRTIRWNGADPSGYINRPRDVAVPQSIADLLADYKARGYTIAIVSNQAGVAFGHTSLRDVVGGFCVTMAMAPAIDRAYWCTDMEGQQGYRLWTDPKTGAVDVDSLGGPVNRDLIGQFRKPNAGLGVVAMDNCGARPQDTEMVGDMDCDQQFAAALGCRFTWAKDWWPSDPILELSRPSSSDAETERE